MSVDPVWRDALGQAGEDLFAEAERCGVWAPNFGPTFLASRVAAKPDPTWLALGCLPIL